jgi:hypothetical protein
MGVEPQVDNVADAESVDIGQLRFGRFEVDPDRATAGAKF